jgi:hypothetical protein
MTIRNLVRASATGLLAAGALAVAATPALAADVDFGLELKGTTIALGANEKPATVSFTNLGTSKPKEVVVLFDATDLKPSVGVDLGECTFEEGVAACTIDEAAIPAPGETSDLDVPLVVKDSSSRGNQGKLSIAVVVEGDTNEANNSKTVDVVLSEEAGVDLRVLAFDVSALDAGGNLTGKGVEPGKHSAAYGYLANHGDLPAANLKVTVTLPKDVTFASKDEGCTYTADNRTATCSAGDYVLQAWDQDTSETKENSAFSTEFEVVVSPDAKGPVSLTGGTWTAEATPVAPTQRKRASGAPISEAEFAGELTKEQVAQVDVDASDNTDGFNILVAGVAGGGTGAGAGGGAGDGDNDGPTLPVTGPVAAGAAGAGALVLAAGAFLFLSARRRRVVLVTPTDGK